ncbi:M23 family metallopeptidase [Archangium sp. miwbw1]|uniref:M23 family metallopeptidase n=1 Tax=Archangium lansingense TaxID=2995310 RepID=A0ABT4ADV5_9BACT|nr:M23 family metallopeptidase [Archangium lansinium]MCY1079399.1 M23 family metallopeptidase [Archangium lansinium]
MAGAIPARAAAFLLLALLATTGCAVVPGATRPTPDSDLAPASEQPPVELGELREPHPEPELVSVRHTVAPGETMYRISRTYGITVEELSEANGITDPRTLSVGQELIIPGFERPVPVATESSPTPEPDEARPVPGSKPPTTRPPASARPPVVVTAPSRMTPRPTSPPAPSRPVPETKGMLDWPLRGVLYARFGKKGREPHDGIDLAAPAGTPVKTAQEGSVLYAGEQRGYGLIVIIQHSEHLITLYAHNRDLRVRTGQKVRRGQVIATVGESGKTSGPQLHLEVRVGGKPVDPLDYLGPLPSS